MYTWNNLAYWRYALAKGMIGNDVAVLQLNLGIPVDGDYQQVTFDAVYDLQKTHFTNPLDWDGIAGGKTQQLIVTIKSRAATKRHLVPNGLLKSICANESGFYLAAFSQHPSDSGYDLGAYQSSIGPEGLADTQDNRTHSYKVTYMADLTAKRVRAAHDSFATTQIVSQDLYDSNYYKQVMADGLNDKFAWSLAVLNHNWPSAAENLATVGSVYKDSTRDDQEEQWIVTASGGRLRTPKEWVTAYVQKSTIYVKWS